MYYDFELEQIIKQISAEWKLETTEREVFSLIQLYRNAEKTADKIKKQIEADMLEDGKHVNGDSMIDIRPFEDVMQEYFRDRFFITKYKGLSVRGYLSSLN